MLTGGLKLDLTDKIYDLGTLPEVGVVPRKMHAWTIRTERLGSINTAFQDEIVDTPLPGAGEVLVAVYAAGVNYNGIWAANGTPKNVIDTNGSYGDKAEDFHICGSEASGVVYAVGEGVTNVAVGDSVLLMSWRYDKDCEYIKNGGEPEFSASYHIWGYESNWGAFAQFCRVYDYQCVKKPDCLSWSEAALCSVTGVTVNRMLRHWKPNEVKAGDVILVWGGSGGLGSSAIQQAKCYGAVPIAVVSSDEKGEYCKSIGAAGYINRTKFSHWGSIDALDERNYKMWLIQAAKFRNEIFSIIGEKKLPDIVIEHPGSDTLATSLFVCSPGGMVVLCGATSGYIGAIDLRYLWIYQKRLQGSHTGSASDCIEYLRLCEEKGLRPVIGKEYSWSELPIAHTDMEASGAVMGKYVIKVVEDNTDQAVNI